MVCEERAAWVALGAVDLLGPVTVWKAVRRLGSAAAVWAGGEAVLGPKTSEALRRARRELDPPAMLERLLSAGDRVLTPVDEEYPSVLLELPDPPLALHARGSWRLDPEAAMVAVVGSRRATPYGLSQAESLSAAMARAGIVVSSGLARGVDGAAHRGSLAGGGPTVAVLGCGLDVDYPFEHRRLRREIEENGMVLSEYPRGVRPEPWRFPARNRILAMVSRVVVVVQAAARSGALITARVALERGRDVLAVPGAVGWATSEGTLRLLKDGAGMCRGLEDVLDSLGFSPSNPAGPVLSAEAASVVAALGAEGAGVDEVVERTALAPGPATALLVRLEMEGVVRRTSHGVYVAV